MSASLQQSRKSVSFAELLEDVHVVDKPEVDREEEYHNVEEIKHRTREAASFWSSNPYERLLMAAYDPEAEINPDAQIYIDVFTRLEENGDTLRGLERHFSRKHFEMRKGAVDELVQTVLNLEADLKYGGSSRTMSQDQIWKELKSISKQHSRAAKVFARRVGKADERVLLEGPQSSSVALELIEAYDRQQKEAEAAKKQAKQSSLDDHLGKHKSSTKSRSGCSVTSSGTSKKLREIRTKKTTSKSEGKRSSKKGNPTDVPKKVGRWGSFKKVLAAAAVTDTKRGI